MKLLIVFGCVFSLALQHICFGQDRSNAHCNASALAIAQPSDLYSVEIVHHYREFLSASAGVQDQSELERSVALCGTVESIARTHDIGPLLPDLALLTAEAKEFPTNFELVWSRNRILEATHTLRAFLSNNLRDKQWIAYLEIHELEAALSSLHEKDVSEELKYFLGKIPDNMLLQNPFPRLSFYGHLRAYRDALLRAYYLRETPSSEVEQKLRLLSSLLRSERLNHQDLRSLVVWLKARGSSPLLVKLIDIKHSGTGVFAAISEDMIQQELSARLESSVSHLALGSQLSGQAIKSRVNFMASSNSAISQVDATVSAMLSQKVGERFQVHGKLSAAFSKLIVVSDNSIQNSPASISLSSQIYGVTAEKRCALAIGDRVIARAIASGARRQTPAIIRQVCDGLRVAENNFDKAIDSQISGLKALATKTLGKSNCVSVKTTDFHLMAEVDIANESGFSGCVRPPPLTRTSGNVLCIHEAAVNNALLEMFSSQDISEHLAKLSGPRIVSRIRSVVLDESQPMIVRFVDDSQFDLQANCRRIAIVSGDRGSNRNARPWIIKEPVSLSCRFRLVSSDGVFVLRQVGDMHVDSKASLDRISLKKLFAEANPVQIQFSISSEYLSLLGLSDLRVDKGGWMYLPFDMRAALKKL